MLDVSEQVDLVGNLELVEDVFALATLLGGEDEITDCETVSVDSVMTVTKITHRQQQC